MMEPDDKRRWGNWFDRIDAGMGNSPSEKEKSLWRQAYADLPDEDKQELKVLRDLLKRNRERGGGTAGHGTREAFVSDVQRHCLDSHGAGATAEIENLLLAISLQLSIVIDTLQQEKP